MIREIDIWRAANLMLKQHGGDAKDESRKQAERLAAAGNDAGVAVWRRIADAVDKLADMTPVRPLH